MSKIQVVTNNKTKSEKLEKQYNVFSQQKMRAKCRKIERKQTGLDNQLAIVI